MGIYIKIEKILEKDNIAYYKINTESFGGANFYIGIDKAKRIFNLYLTDYFSKPVRIINCDDPDVRVGSLPGVDASVLGRVLMQASKVLELDSFPDYMDYAS